MKKSVLLIASILLLISTGAAAPTPTVSVEPSSMSVKVGENVTVNISVNPYTLKVFGAQFSLDYNSSILNATSIVKGPFLTQDGASSIVVKSVCDNAANKCDYAETRIGVTNGVTTPGTIATITFRADAAGTVPLNLINVMMTDPSPADISGLIVNNGSVTVSSPPTPTPIPSNGGSSGGGTSGEEFKNIEKQDRKDAFVYAGKLTSFQFSDAGPIEFINFTGKKNLGETTVKVEVLKNTSTLVNHTPPGAVYRNINLWVGTSGFARPENIENPVVKFKVENAWLSSNNFAAGDVELLRWNNSAWNELETIQVGKNDTYTSFEAGTDYFSPFVISAKKSTQSVAAELPANTERVQETSGTPAAPDQKTPGFESVSVMATLIAIYIFSRKR